MPRYTYRCKACETISVVTHRMGVSLTDCGECKKNTLQRIPSQISLKVKSAPAKKEKPGKRVKAHIEEARADLKIEKNRLRSLDGKK